MAIASGTNPFRGVWRRRFIQFDGGAKEDTQQVLWLQAESSFADVRSGAFAGPLTHERYQAMTWRQRFDADLLGFAGHFTWSPSSATQGTCTWHHTIAITPRTWPDSSTYQWIGPHEILERGVCQDDQGQSRDFLEHWHRIYDGDITVHPVSRTPYQGQGLLGEDWAVIVYGQSDSFLPPGKQTSIFRDFSASAWHRVSGIWKLQFGSHTYFGNQPIWTPDHLNAHPYSGELS